MLVMWSEISSMVVLYGGCSRWCGCICWLNIWSMICNSDAKSGSGCKVGGVAFCVVVFCCVVVVGCSGFWVCGYSGIVCVWLRLVSSIVSCRWWYGSSCSNGILCVMRRVVVGRFLRLRLCVSRMMCASACESG